MNAISQRSVRLPAVAGAFYPRDPRELAGAVDDLLATITVPPLQGRLRALVAPHAGYAYSGPTAAHAFKLLTGRDYSTVMVLGPSHFAHFKGACLPASDAYGGPLGEVPVSPLVKRLANQRPFVLEPRCRVDRPPWGRPHPAGEATPETWEHAIEVEIPFLQRTLGRFDVLPVLYGDVEPSDVARELSPLLTDNSLLVVSTDLSHFHAYREAQGLDRSCVEAMCQLDEHRMAHEEACGRAPLCSLLRIAKERGWQAHLLDCRNSGDTAGDRSRVVGYAAIAFFDRTVEESTTEAGSLSPGDRRFLLQLARQSIVSAVSGPDTSTPSPLEIPPACRERRACFVTLRAKGKLRGCIGTLTSSQPLFQAVIRNARDAAMRDSRFPAVRVEEMEALCLEVSVLTEPVRMSFLGPQDLLSQLRPLLDGVLLEVGGRRATFLPQVWEQLPDKAEFMAQLCHKAGLAPDAWQDSEAVISRYQVEHFSETAPA